MMCSMDSMSRSRFAWLSLRDFSSAFPVSILANTLRNPCPSASFRWSISPWGPNSLGSSPPASMPRTYHVSSSYRWDAWARSSSTVASGRSTRGARRTRRVRLRVPLVALGAAPVEMTVGAEIGRRQVRPTSRVNLVAVVGEPLAPALRRRVAERGDTVTLWASLAGGRHRFDRRSIAEEGSRPWTGSTARP